MKGNRTKILRNRVAQEAALLLYTSQEKEYKQAKKRAAETLGARVHPSNFEVAEELDRIAEEREGTQKRELLLRMRKEAKELMEVLEEFRPRLVGSVWRGTARRNSDIDIVTFSEDTVKVLGQLQKHSFEVGRSERLSVTKEGKKEDSFHIHVVLPSLFRSVELTSLNILGGIVIFPSAVSRITAEELISIISPSILPILINWPS